MHHTPQAQAIMLLTVSLGKPNSSNEKPLSNSEWARFATWLKDHRLEPATLLEDDPDTLLSGWMDRTVTVARLRALLGRGSALGFSLEKWQRAGLWVLTRSDPEYPGRLKRRLRAESPAVLFGCGNKTLLKGGGIAVVGSRDASEEDLAFTEKLGRRAAAQGYSIVSGGARGVDQRAMIGALDGEGTAVGVLADSLLGSATSSRYRKHIMSDDLVLITPFNPEARFNVGNAMSRNRYIYCLADAAIVISSTPDKGGTWNGAREDLRNEWVPLWVKPSTSEGSGNSKLLKHGAQSLPEDLDSLSDLRNGSSSDSVHAAQGGGPPLAPRNAERKEEEQNADPVPVPPSEPLAETVPTSLRASAEPPTLAGVDFYTLFQAHLDLTLSTPKGIDDIAACLDLEKSQVMAWIKRAVDDKKVDKLNRPVRYQLAAAERKSIVDPGDLR